MACFKLKAAMHLLPFPAYSLPSPSIRPPLAAVPIHASLPAHFYRPSSLSLCHSLLRGQRNASILSLRALLFRDGDGHGGEGRRQYGSTHGERDRANSHLRDGEDSDRLHCSSFEAHHDHSAPGQPLEHQQSLWDSPNHGHSHAGDRKHMDEFNAVQMAIVNAAAAVGLTRLADALRDNFRLCCASMALLLLAALCPYVLPAKIRSSVQTGLIVSGFPLVGVPAILDAAVDVAGLRVNIHVLMALASFASVLMGNALEGGLLLAMFSLAHIAEDHFSESAMGDVKALKDSNPEFALVLDSFDASSPRLLSTMTYKEWPVQMVEPGSYILVRAGEAVPVDGEVSQGRSTVTVEHLTGESSPIEAQIGSKVLGGARNLDGMMIIKATRTWQDSTLARIVKLTEEARLNRPKLQRWLDEFGEHYSQAVVAVSVSVALLGPVFFKWPFINSSGVRSSVYRALGLMVAASPCALAVAPLAYVTAISSCARKGILLKGGQALDSLAACNTIAFDKTGTLTTGELICKAIEPIDGHSSNGLNTFKFQPCCSPTCEIEALAVAAAMEQGAIHPIARAVLDHSEGKKLPAVTIENFESFPGKGLAASVTGLESEKGGPHRAFLGSLEYVASSSKSTFDSERIREAARCSSYSSELIRAALSVSQKVTLFHFEDKLRPGVAGVVASLKQAGLHVLMLTGDHASSAQRVAKSVGIDDVYFGLKPEDKLNQVKNLSRYTGKYSSTGMIMVGDGINDAPALAAATVGIVLAQHASATAMAVADVLLLHDNIDSVPFVIAKARQTTALVKQSVALALMCILLAALPSILGFLPLWLTVLLHEGGTLLVCVNSARALNDPIYLWNQGHDGMRWLLDSISSIIN